MASNPSVIVIGGPTASGKSALAIDLALRLDGVVINADAMQVYRELEVLTARPGAEDVTRVPHRLYGVIPAATRCSAAAWADMALAEIDVARRHGRRPIVVGGTGLYLRALLEGLNQIPAIPEHIRRATIEMHRELGSEAFHEALARWDSRMAARLRPGDTQRLIRAWEVMVATNRSLADWQEGAAVGPPPDMTFDLVVLAPSRETLYTAADARFLAMLERGAVQEVENLMALNLDPELPAMKAIGVPELSSHLRGALSLDEAVARAQQATRNLAKRQLTWFRHQLPEPAGQVQGCHVVTAQYSESYLMQILSNIQKSG